MRAAAVVDGARVPASLAALVVHLNVDDVVEIALNDGSVEAGQFVRFLDFHGLKIGPVEIVLVLRESERVLNVVADDDFEVPAVGVGARDVLVVHVRPIKAPFADRLLVLVLQVRSAVVDGKPVDAAHAQDRLPPRSVQKRLFDARAIGAPVGPVHVALLRIEHDSPGIVDSFPQQHASGFAVETGDFDLARVRPVNVLSDPVDRHALGQIQAVLDDVLRVAPGEREGARYMKR